MRLTVDPDEPVEQTLLMTREDHDRDMEGVFDLYDFFAGENE